MLWYHSALEPFLDHTYKVEQGVQCDLRIFPSESTSTGIPTPWVLYVHGGAFVAGKHYVPNAWVVPALRPRAYHVVSVSYRFAPHCSLSQQVGDVKDAFEWCQTNLPRILSVNGAKVDLERYVVIGESAGGLIVSLLPFVLDPKPRVVVDIYGPTDLAAQHWSSTPSNANEDGGNTVHIQPLSGEFPEDEVINAAKSRDASLAMTVCPFEFDVPVETYRDLWKVPDYEYTREQRFQYDIKRHLRTTKTLIDVLLRKEECQSDEEWRKRLEDHSPVHLLRQRGSYPPTVLLYGKDDPVVPLDQAASFAGILRENKVDVIELYEPGEGHEFDNKYTAPAVEGWHTYIAPIIQFVEKHV
ncbi:uncharacterized protein I303_102086 [Kwoniella dejecticola CBS 10117]|uniref:Alpha/beta hydrolase fold-3 domain-containing protein n=1 Tax=Kwoniella dejecticola CBS 10117 TaxID=1296121 RepID=A0A1A6ABY7_9TREE|nr:uncharacterized protein I303_01773 [Kwoniella dejecticola CBS 10117]OBR87565.1 hypothetical protein I303_01773 [Kwoniella dejecticola CBS 10117]